MIKYKEYGLNFGGPNEIENYLFELTLLRPNPLFILLQAIIICVLIWIGIIFGPLGFVIYFFIVIRYVIKWINNTNSFSKLINNILKLYRLYQKNNHKFLEIEEILQASHDIYQGVILMNESLKYSFLLTQKSKLHIEKLKDFAIGISYSFLSNLKSNLTLRLTEQEQSLESAKSEVKSNIKGTTELNQVSELQRTRLDKQIEQFEELQRVLVKI